MKTTLSLFLVISICACSSTKWSVSSEQQVSQSDTIYVHFKKGENFKKREMSIEFCENYLKQPSSRKYYYAYEYLYPDTSESEMEIRRPGVGFYECDRVGTSYETKEVDKKWLRKRAIIDESYFKQQGIDHMSLPEYRDKIYYIFETTNDKKQEKIEIRQVFFSIIELRIDH